LAQAILAQAILAQVKFRLNSVCLCNRSNLSIHIQTPTGHVHFPLLVLW
jgi:hypothetical protein